MVCIVAQLLALLTWVGGVKCRFYCFIDVLFPVVPRPHFFQHLCVAPTTYCDSNQSRYMYNIINIVFTSQWKCSTRLWSFEDLFEKRKKNSCTTIYACSEVLYNSTIRQRCSRDSVKVDYVALCLVWKVEKKETLQNIEESRLQQSVVTPSPSSHGPSHLQPRSRYHHSAL